MTNHTIAWIFILGVFLGGIFVLPGLMEENDLSGQAYISLIPEHVVKQTGVWRTTAGLDGEMSFNLFCAPDLPLAFMTCSERVINLTSLTRPGIGAKAISSCGSSQGLPIMAVFCGEEHTVKWSEVKSIHNSLTLNQFCAPLRPLKASTCPGFTGGKVIDVHGMGDEMFHSCEDGSHPYEYTWAAIACG